MKIISIDFNSNIICFTGKEERRIKSTDELKKEDFIGFIPRKHMEYNSFSWNFEAETFAVNQENKRIEECDTEKDYFRPQFIIPMKGLRKRYKEFVAIMGDETLQLEEVSLKIKKFLYK